MMQNSSAFRTRRFRKCDGALPLETGCFGSSTLIVGQAFHLLGAVSATRQALSLLGLREGPDLTLLHGVWPLEPCSAQGPVAFSFYCFCVLLLIRKGCVFVFELTERQPSFTIV